MVLMLLMMMVMVIMMMLLMMLLFMSLLMALLTFMLLRLLALLLLLVLLLLLMLPLMLMVLVLLLLIWYGMVWYGNQGQCPYQSRVARADYGRTERRREKGPARATGESPSEGQRGGCLPREGGGARPPEATRCRPAPRQQAAGSRRGHAPSQPMSAPKAAATVALSEQAARSE